MVDQTEKVMLLMLTGFNKKPVSIAVTGLRTFYRYKYFIKAGSLC